MVLGAKRPAARPPARDSASPWSRSLNGACSSRSTARRLADQQYATGVGDQPMHQAQSFNSGCVARNASITTPALELHCRRATRDAQALAPHRDEIRQVLMNDRACSLRTHAVSAKSDALGRALLLPVFLCSGGRRIRSPSTSRRCSGLRALAVRRTLRPCAGARRPRAARQHLSR